MNDKNSAIYDILNIVVEECTGVVNRDAMVTDKDVLGKCKRENVIITRCLFVAQLRNAGYSESDIAAVLGRQKRAIHDILATAYGYKKKSKMFRITDAKITLKIDELLPDLETFVK